MHNSEIYNIGAHAFSSYGASDVWAITNLYKLKAYLPQMIHDERCKFLYKSMPQFNLEDIDLKFQQLGMYNLIGRGQQL